MKPNAFSRKLHEVERSLRTFAQALGAHPAAWIGFACVCAWPWSCTSAVLAHGIATGSPSWTQSNATYLVIALAGLILGLRYREADPRISATATAIIAGICYVTSSTLLVVQYQTPIDGLAGFNMASFLWPLLAGIGQALFLVSWVRAFGFVGPQTTIVLVVAASVSGAAFVFALNLVPQQVREFSPALVGAVGALCSALMWRSLRTSHREDDPLLPISRQDGKLKLPWKLLITAVIAGMAFGLFQSFSFSGSFGQVAWHLFGVAGFLGAALMFALITLALKMNFNYMIYRLSFVIMAAGCLVCLLAPAASGWGYGIFCLGYRCFDMLLWCLCAYLIYYRKVPAGWLAGLCVCALQTGRFLGFEIFRLLDEGGILPAEPVVIAIVLFGIMLTALSLVNHNNLLEAWGMAKPGEADGRSEAIALCCERLSDEYLLSAREREVFDLLAQGTSRADIGKELVLSEETVKTHIRHIYQKCNVHSRKELSDLVTTCVDELVSGSLRAAGRDANS